MCDLIAGDNLSFQKMPTWVSVILSNLDRDDSSSEGAGTVGGGGRLDDGVQPVTFRTGDHELVMDREPAMDRKLAIATMNRDDGIRCVGSLCVA